MVFSVKVENFTFKVWQGAFDALEIEKTCIGLENAVLVLPFSSMPEIDLSEEIVGAATYMKNLADFSKKINSSIFCGAKTKSLEVRHISVVVCNKGRLVDIADRTSNPFDDNLGTSNKIKVYSSKKGKIGLLIDADCTIENNWIKTAPSSDVMLCINRGSSLYAKQEVKKLASTYGMPYIYVDEVSVDFANS